MIDSAFASSGSAQRPVFIVRLWWEAAVETEGSSPEAGEAPAGEWRGSVERLAQKQRRFFHRLSDISTIIADWLEEDPATPRP